MPRYTDESKERVRDAVDFVDLVGSRVELRRAGASRYEGLCPFHDERTPSFGINPADKVFYCFGCGTGGDVYKYVELTEGLDFVQSMEFLAQRYGVELEVVDEDPAAAERRRGRERLLELLERTAAFYVRYLWESAEAAPAREYLAGRGLEEGALREFRVGYAPSAYDKLLRAMRQGGFSNREAFDAGLAVRSKGRGMLYDRFRRRITFPLCDLRGRVLGFGARAIGADQQPKYLNSADGPVYHKGRHLFGADIARAAAAKAASVVLAEGYTDVIALHQAGLRNTVGLMGTALTEDQVGELARLAPVVQMALDADSAGQEAMLRAARVAARSRIELRVVPLPAGSDPAELVAERGGEEMARLVSESVPFVRFRVERELARADLRSGEGKDKAIDALRPVFAELPPSAMREELVALVADRVDIQPALVASWLAQPAPRDGGAVQRATAPAQAPRPGRLDPATRAERAFLLQCIALPDAGREALAAVSEEEFTSELHRRALRHLRAHLDAPAERVADGDDELATLLAELSVRAGREHTSRAALKGETLKLELARLERQIAAARTGGGGDIVALKERQREAMALLDRAIETVVAETQVSADA